MYKLLRKIRWLHWIHREAYLQARLWFICCPHSLIARWRYSRILKAVVESCKKRPVKVLFPFSGSVSKWKMQSLFECMMGCKRYEPIIAITCYDIMQTASIEEKKKNAKDIKRYFSRKGMRCVDAYDYENDKPIPFSRFKPDIVWYQNPWITCKSQMPLAVSKYALTCYIPYFVQNYGALEMDCETLFHRELWRHFTLNEVWAKVFMEDQGRICRAGRVVGLGHPMLDQFSHDRQKDHKSNKEFVIYAPHWSCGVGECFSTFMKNGQDILNLARQHPEINWVFKPHPTLRHTLINGKLMSHQEVDEYYEAWSNIGKVSIEEDYVGLFLESKALITDCASFLVEYACVKKPIIHLISSDAVYVPHPAVRGLFDSYYGVKNWNEFMKCFERVVIEGDDYKKEERLMHINVMELDKGNATKRILDYCDSVFWSSES